MENCYTLGQSLRYLGTGTSLCQSQKPPPLKKGQRLKLQALNLTSKAATYRKGRKGTGLSDGDCIQGLFVCGIELIWAQNQCTKWHQIEIFVHLSSFSVLKTNLRSTRRHIIIIVLSVYTILLNLWDKIINRNCFLTD